MSGGLFGIRKKITRRQSYVLGVLSFALPLMIWCAISYIPWIYHPLVKVVDSGDSMMVAKNDLLEITSFESENINITENGGLPMTGIRVNPNYVPAPHDVGRALVTAFTTEPRRDTEPWFHESLAHSIRIVFFAFFLSSMVGVPLGILCGSFQIFEKLFEPVAEFIRYFPAPMFATVAVAMLGIADAPKIAIIVIGTFFQQLPMIANTTRMADKNLIEAAETLGAGRLRILLGVIVPSVLPKLYKDMRILLGWAWTYLIVAEVVGTTSGITWFITQQAKYRNFDNVYAAIVIIGCIGLFCDMFLAWLSRYLFPWEKGVSNRLTRMVSEIFAPRNRVFSFMLTKEEKEYLARHG